ncbi:unnamed protein product [Ambrosiozyma monospora]|uniref:Unnamed protein product n=1 Tax=Ambrosiozyma monospora TaxID=43982 RepID=A0ACB5T3Q5_AMBMO|nr:unnamed protein product [Ambrosiozyma monospora]
MHLGIPKKSDLKPKKQKSILPFPVTFSTKFRRFRNGKPLLSLLVIVFVVNYLFKSFLCPASNTANSVSFKHLTNQKALETVQKSHGIYKNEVPVSSLYIFPPIEHAPLLRELTLDKLFKYKVNSDYGGDESKVYYYPDDDESESNELKDSEDSKNPLDIAKKKFKENELTTLIPTNTVFT